MTLVKSVNNYSRAGVVSGVISGYFVGKWVVGVVKSGYFVKKIKIRVKGNLWLGRTRIILKSAAKEFFAPHKAFIELTNDIKTDLKKLVVKIKATFF
jgi:hypothetical protein